MERFLKAIKTGFLFTVALIAISGIVIILVAVGKYLSYINPLYAILEIILSTFVIVSLVEYFFNN